MPPRLPYKYATRWKPDGACHCNLDDESCYAAGHWTPNGHFMDPHISVFNGHVHKAADRALKDVANKYPPGNRHMRALIRMKRTGIMEIFQGKPTGPAKEFVVRVFAYVNDIPLGVARAWMKWKPDATPA